LKTIIRSSANLLLVAEPGEPGSLLELKKAVEEINGVAEVVKRNRDAPTESNNGGQVQLLTSPTKQEVVDSLRKASFLHLACHGKQHPTDPLASGFLLRREKLTVLELMQLKLSGPFLSFLSACETAKGDRSQPDQVMHLATTMLFIGFRSVVGTMWYGLQSTKSFLEQKSDCVFVTNFSPRAMWDKDGPFVAQTLYDELYKSENLDPDTIPYALDAAVHRLRESGQPAERWATYIHIGV
jgi:hypothetical protein